MSASINSHIKDRYNHNGIRVHNNTGSVIAADKLVAVLGFDTTAQCPRVVLADADATGGKHLDVYVALTAIGIGDTGIVYKGGVSGNLDTNSASAAGDPVYLSTTAGGFVHTAPSGADDVVMPVGWVFTKSATVGEIFWNVGAPSKFGLNELQTVVDGVTLDAGGTGSTFEIAPNVLQIATGSISAANITATTAGTLGHSDGVVLVAPQGAHKIVELVSAVLINDFGVAAYTDGGDTTIKIAGGAALTAVISNANFIQAAADKVVQVVPLVAAWHTYTENNGLNLVTAAAPTNPGTAAGVFRWVVLYRVHSTGL